MLDVALMNLLKVGLKANNDVGGIIIDREGFSSY